MASNYEGDREVTFEITEHLGVIAAYSTGWKKELNIVSWNGGAPKYDIRDWDPEHEHMSRGITLHEKEMRLVVDMVKRNRQAKTYAARNTSEDQSDTQSNSQKAPASGEDIQITESEYTEQ